MSDRIAKWITKLAFKVLDPVLDSFYESLAEQATDINKLEGRVRRLEAFRDAEIALREFQQKGSE